MAQADMRFIGQLALPAIATVSPVRRKAPAIATTRSLLELVAAADDQDVIALLIAEHGGLRQEYPGGVTHLDIGARKGARPQILIRRQDNTHGALPRAGIDDRPDLPDCAGKALGHTVQSHRGALPERQSRHILLGHLPAHLNLGIAREVK
jgi:hypothetical protein